MIRLTVLYNLPAEIDEDEFLRWRLSEHQADNAAIGGVIHTDFARTTDSWPTGTAPKYRFVTTVDWPDRKSFHRGFDSPQVQAKLHEDAKMLRDAVFLVSEILTSQDL